MIEEEILDDDVRDPIRVRRSGIVNDGLLQQLFRLKSHERRSGVVVALTAPNRGAGVTQVTEALGDQLGSDNGGNVVVLDARAMDDLKASGNAGPQVEVVPPGYRMGPLAHWRAMATAFAPGCCIGCAAAINTSSLTARHCTDSQEVLNLAPLVDGVIVVVEANRTRRSQIAFLERIIAGARGHVLGHVLNKRTYAIPPWLYRRLDA